ncbi:MAG: YciI family protein [Colwellia sp.]|nr:YciI family protein [Colwellia sp.]
MFLINMVFTDITKLTDKLTEQHRDYIGKEYLQNKLMFGGRKVPRTGGIILSKHQSQDELIKLLDADPFIENGVASYSIIEFVPVMASREFENVLGLT